MYRRFIGQCSWDQHLFKEGKGVRLGKEIIPYIITASSDAVSMEASTLPEEYSKGRMTPQSFPELR